MNLLDRQLAGQRIFADGMQQGSTAFGPAQTHFHTGQMDTVTG